MLTRSQLSLAHNAKVKTDMPEKNEKQLEYISGIAVDTLLVGYACSYH